MGQIRVILFFLSQWASTVHVVTWSHDHVTVMWSHDTVLVGAGELYVAAVYGVCMDVPATLSRPLLCVGCGIEFSRDLLLGFVVIRRFHIRLLGIPAHLHCSACMVLYFETRLELSHKNCHLISLWKEHFYYSSQQSFVARNHLWSHTFLFACKQTTWDISSGSYYCDCMPTSVAIQWVFNEMKLSQVNTTLACYQMQLPVSIQSCDCLYPSGHVTACIYPVMWLPVSIQSRDCLYPSSHATACIHPGTGMLVSIQACNCLYPSGHSQTNSKGRHRPIKGSA